MEFKRDFFAAFKDNNPDSGLFSKLMLQKNPSLCLKCLVNIERKVSRLKHIIKRKLCHFFYVPLTYDTVMTFVIVKCLIW